MGKNKILKTNKKLKIKNLFPPIKAPQYFNLIIAIFYTIACNRCVQE